MNNKVKWQSLPLITFGLFSCLNLVNGLIPPKVKPFTFNPDVLEDHREQIFCSVFKGDPPLTFAWYKDNVPLKLTNAINIEDLNEFTSALTIASVTSEHIGNYTCTASNSAGYDSHTSTLIVKASPMLVKDLYDVSNTEDSTLGIDCVIRGYPKPTITWSKENVNGNHHELSVNSVRPIVYANGTLFFGTLQHSDAGRYTCHASNGVGNNFKKTITLSVHSTPKMTNASTKLTVSSGHVASLECRGKGDPPVEIVWIKGHSEVRESERFEIRDRTTADGVVSELILISVVRSDAGIYKCVVRNKFGKDERNIILKVVETPESPKEVKILDIWSRSVYVIWSSAYDGGSPLYKYVMQYWKDIDGVPHRLQEAEVLPSTNSHLLSELEPGFQYAVRVIAESEIGRGPPSMTVSFQTEEEAPSGSPTDVSVIAKNANSITIGWKPPPREHWNGGIKGYYAGIKSHGNSERHAFFTVTTPIGETAFIQHRFTHLKKATRYSIIVRAFNGAGTGPNSHEFQTETRDIGMSKPSQFHVSDCSTYSITLKWKKFDSSVTEISYVIIHFRQVGSVSWIEHKVDLEIDSFVINELEPGTRYQAYLTAHGDADISSDPTEILTVFTEGINDHLPKLGTSQGIFVEQTLPKLVRMEVLIPVLACIVIIVTVIVVSCAYVARSKARYIAMADAQYIGAYDTARLSQCYHPVTAMAASMQSGNAPSDDTSYDTPWDVPQSRI